MSQGGLKHAATESRLDTKRERRRGAAGRAAALRRAPSDSDCSGETASLSADSGDRAIRPIPQPARSGKSRSRRRGSEWEVLEGLKDGQRFEKRPDVFNGYLHKKRKWPLKGWHKRYFVVDGGILVYARSPTDVARGRLHGSVDVGLSVISAKARRRRIDIDADEFIYHLRAKTPDVFRTWLNVLKAHRLYRQHLLTFGARESAPKIHPPLEDIPPTDTSSRSSCVSMVTTESISTEDLTKSEESHTTPLSNKASSTTKASVVTEKMLTNNDPENNADGKRKSAAVINLSIVNVEPNVVELNRKSKDVDVKSVFVKQKSNGDEKNPEYKFLNVAAQFRKRSKANRDILRQMKNNTDETNSSLFRNKKTEPTTTYFFFTRKKTFRECEYMKRSRKSTNLVKYKNILDEPKLKRPLSKCMLLGKYPPMKLSEPSLTSKCLSELGYFKKSTSRTLHPYDEPKPLEVIMKSKEFINSSIQDTMSASEYSEITEKVLLSIFRNRNPYSSSSQSDLKIFINKIVEELYEVKLYQIDANPVKTLFRCLLEFWLKNNKNELFQNVTLAAKSVGPRSNSCFTVDKEISSVRISLQSKGTQCQVVSPVGRQVVRQPETYKKTNDTTKLVGKPPKCRKEKVKPPSHSPRRDTESFEKERRVQELERILKNTIYVCDVQSLENKEKDVRITKALLDNLSCHSKTFDANRSSDMHDSSSSAEVPKIRETINHLISDTSMPPDVAKEFLNAYLDVLNNDSSKSATENSTSASADTLGKPVEIDCDVQTEAVQRKISKSVTTDQKSDKADFVNDKDKSKDVDPGQQYLKDILDKVTTIFSKVNIDRGQRNNTAKSKVETNVKDELGRPVINYPGKNLIREDYETNSVIIDLSKYDLEHISMFSDPNVKDIMSITIKLKEKPQSSGETQKAHLSLKFSDDDLRTTRSEFKQWMKVTSNSSSNIFEVKKKKYKRSVLDFNTGQPINDLKPYTSSCEISSKACCRIVHESEHSLDLSFKSSKFYQHSKKSEKNEDPQSCYIMSFQKKNLASKPLKTKKKVRLKECHGLILNSRTNSSTRQKCACPEDYTMFERPAPKLIDEKFILMLLENLTFLSKDLPALHKDINSLYIKLKKKHEKVVKNCNNIQGLSLLGKIYNDEYLKPNDIQTQASASKSTTQIVSNANKETVATNTSDLLNKVVIPTYISSVLNKKIVSTNTSNVIDTNDVPTNTSQIPYTIMGTNTSEVRKGVVATTTSLLENCVPKNITSEKEMLTEALVVEFDSHKKAAAMKNFDNYNSSSQTIRYDTSSCKEITADQAVSEQNWHKKVHTEDCAVSTVIKCFLNKLTDNEESASKFENMVTSLQISVPKKSKKEGRVKHNRNLINEIKLPPAFKVSTLSQTERNFENKSTDFHVYQLHSFFAEKEVDCMSDSSDIRRWKSDIRLLYKCRSEPSLGSGLVSPMSGPLRGPQAGFVTGTPGGRLAGWIIESGGPLENASRELGQAQLSVQQLQRLLDALELQQQVHHDTDVSLEGASPNVKKDRRKFGLRKKKSNSKCASIELTSQHIDPSTSHMALSALTAPPSPGGGASSIPNSAASLPIACAAARPQSLPGAEALATGNNAGPASLTSLTPDHQLREDFTVLAKDLVANLKSIVSTLVCERGRLRAAMEAADSTAAPPGAMVAALRTNLTSALQQNSELRSRLSRIHDASDLAEISSMGANDPVVRQFQQSLSYSSSCVSASEFFDAEEHEDEAIKVEPIIQADEAGVIELDGDSSSEAGSLSSEEGSASSDNSDGAMPSVEQPTLRASQNGVAEAGGSWSRRTRLPCARPTPGGPSLWNLLYKNIGKDLSQVSMPVTINEPLNMLQRLCEELEYSELLDSAAECANAVERMALIAAFAVSAYASSAHRAASKPFNPLLAETYECIRDDKGFRFIAEQVSHHPPISACHAESARWKFWQEARIKTKFWGKSMEFQPAGRVHVRLASGDHYSWNKVTTCVHNLFGGQRWVDQYGDMHITSHGTDITCKLNFVKASSWSSTKHEVRGAVCAGSGARLRLQGRWSEALYAGEPPAARCLWRPAYTEGHLQGECRGPRDTTDLEALCAMPPEHELYYGFTRFAMELNEIEPGMRDVLPHTDTRLRPDQRALEEGDVESAELHKHALEQAQRERRRDAATHTPAWFRKALEGGEETWVFTGEYWRARDHGFPHHSAPRIW